MRKKKTFVEDIERTLYDIKNEDRPLYRTEEGLTEEIVRDISAKKKDPAWMLEFRLHSLDVYNHTPMPAWGPDLSALDMDHIVTYVQPDARMAGRWEDVPEDIRDTFDRLGIPEAEKTSLAGVGAQYDSEVVYHSVQESLRKKGVVYTDMETALREHEALVKEYFMKLVPPKDPAAILFPAQRAGSGTVRAYADHRRAGGEPAFHRRLLGPEIQRDKPPCRVRGAVHQGRGAAEIFDDRELVAQHDEP